jgi:hypothetical protein
MLIWDAHFDTWAAMFNTLILVVMLGILVSLGGGLVFLVRDAGKSDRTVKSLSIRVALSVLLLILLALGFIVRYSTLS